MYKKSFFIIVFCLLLVGILSAGAEYIPTIPGVQYPPSHYDPGLTIQKAVQTSKTPLLVEFYTDTCRTCRYVTPIVNKLKPAYAQQLTFVMVDVNNPEHQPVAQIFGITYVPAIYVFDFKHMQKAEIPIEQYRDETTLKAGIQAAMATVEKKVAQKQRHTAS